MDPFLPVRITENLRRAIRAFDHSTQLRAQSQRLKQQLRVRRGQRLQRPTLPTEIVWTSADRSVVCRLTEREPSIHEVDVTVDGESVTRRVFDDPVEAADEAYRLRRDFLDP